MVIFYRDIIGLPVLETFQDKYGLDGRILGLPGGSVRVEDSLSRIGNPMKRHVGAPPGLPVILTAARLW